MTRQRYSRNHPSVTRNATPSGQSMNDVERILRFCHQDLPQIDATAEDETKYPAQRRSIELPRFGSLAEHGIADDRTRKLWEFEIQRLMDARTRHADGSAESVFPDLDVGDDILFSPISGKSSDYLSNLASRALCSLYVSILDDEFCHSSREAPDENKIWRASSYLRRIAGELPPVPGQQGSEFESGKSYDGRATKQRPPLVSLELTKSELEHYHHLVDQITATLAFVAVKSDASSWWELVVLACLAKLSTKMKALAILLPICTGRYARENIPTLISEKRSTLDEIHDRFVGQYSQQHKGVSAWMSDCIEQALGDLGADVPLKMKWDDLDTCTFMYETGTAATRTFVYQGRWGEIGGTSDTICLSWASNSMELAASLAEKIAIVSRTGPNRPTLRETEIVVNFTARAQTTMPWGVSNKANEVKIRDVHVQVRNLVHLIVLMSPMSLASPSLAFGFASCLKMVSALSSSRASEVGRTSASVKGFLSLKATPRKTEANRRTNGQSQSSVSSLSESKLVKSGSLTDRLGHRKRGSNRHLQEGRNGIRKAPSKIERLNGLVIQESSIKVKCRLYVYSVFASTTVLVIGGLVSAFLVGERIPGVDPFNLAIYSWFTGGLVLLIAKIVQVSDWTWREFFLGEVACRSLSEVASLTGLDTQEILVHLLSTEGQTILRTGGPYQRCFSKEPVSNGFCIDEMPTVQTLNDAGILLGKVLTLEGPAVILLRLTPGIWGVVYLNLEGGTYVADVCLDPPDENGSRKAVIARRHIHWVKVLGLYEQSGVRFG